MTKSEILEKAKREYPIGTVFFCNFEDFSGKKKSDAFAFSTVRLELEWEDNGISHSRIPWVYCKSQDGTERWAEIISKPEPPEYYECIKSNNGGFTVGKVYKINNPKNLEDDHNFINDHGISNGWSGSNYEYFKPSTKEAFDTQNVQYWADDDCIVKTTHIPKPGYAYLEGAGIRLSTEAYSGKNTFALKGTARPATKEEIEWVNCCIEQGKYVKRIIPQKALQFETGRWYKVVSGRSILEDKYYIKSPFLEDNVIKSKEYIGGCGRTYYEKTENYFSWGDIGYYTFVLMNDLSEIQQYLPEGHVDKIKEDRILEKSELVIGEIYTHTNTAIMKYNGSGNCAHIGYRRNEYSSHGGAFTLTGLRKATPEEKQWLEACIKADKFIPMEEALKTSKFPDLIAGSWYRFNSCYYDWLIKFSHFDKDQLYATKAVCRTDGEKSTSKPYSRFNFDPKYLLVANMEEVYKYFPEEKPVEKWVPKVGDWVVIQGGGNGFDKSHTGIYKLYDMSVKKDKHHGGHLKEESSFDFEYKPGCFYSTRLSHIIRLAEPHEIPPMTQRVIHSELTSLPEKWCIKVDTENCDTLDRWRKEQPGFSLSNIPCMHWVVSNKQDGSYCNYSTSIPANYTEITFDEFKKWVLRPEKFMNTEFKVGDNVICIKEYEHIQKGDTGKITKIVSESSSIGVYWNREGCYYLPKENLELDNSPKKEDLTGRWLKALKDEAQGIGRLSKGQYVQIAKWGPTGENDLEPIEGLGGGWVYDTQSIGTEWELMPEGFIPIKEEPVFDKKELLLQEARLKYPVGTKFYVAHLKGRSSNYIGVITKDDIFQFESSESNTIITGKITEHGWTKCIYSGGKWAEIIENPNEDWCVKRTRENTKSIIEWGKKVGQGWVGDEEYYGRISVKKKYTCSPNPWGKVLTTEEFYQKISKPIIYGTAGEIPEVTNIKAYQWPLTPKECNQLPALINLEENGLIEPYVQSTKSIKTELVQEKQVILF